MIFRAPDLCFLLFKPLPLPRQRQLQVEHGKLLVTLAHSQVSLQEREPRSGGGWQTEQT